MPFFDVVDCGVLDKPRKWLFLLMGHDASECFLNILLPVLPNARMTEVGLCEAVRERFLDGNMNPGLTAIAFARKWIALKDVIEFDQEHDEAPVLRTALRSASPEDVNAVIAYWNSRPTRNRPYGGMSANARPAFRQFQRVTQPRSMPLWMQWMRMTAISNDTLYNTSCEDAPWTLCL
jgi:hypothetical protein